MTLYLLRHGATAANFAGAYLGREDVRLSPAGREALQVRPALPQAEMVVSSPLLRCLETARILYPHQDCMVEDGLVERDFGRYSGLTHQQITALPGNSQWGMSREQMPFPGGEGMEDFRERCQQALERLGKMALEKDACSLSVVTHGGVIMAMMEYATDSPNSFYSWHCPCGGGWQVALSPDWRAIAPPVPL